jgi:solute carrier family 35, member F1/2
MKIVQEFCVKKRDRVEVVAMLGVFGTLISVIEMYPLCCLDGI